MNVKELKMLGKQEMLLPELIGKVSERIQGSSTDTRPFFRAKTKLVEAGNVVEDFIESGDVLLKKETTHEDGVFRTLNKVTIVGGKSKVKDLLRGFETQPGKVYQRSVRNSTLRLADKNVLRTLSSIPFVRSEFATDEYLQKIQDLIPVDSNTRERPYKRKARMESYKEAALGVQGTYLSAKFDGRGRMNYEGARLEGFRPHGKSYESFLFELTPRGLDDGGKEVLEALHYDEGILKELRDNQISKAQELGYTGMTVECDITNSGLLIAGLSFKSPEMLQATNGYAGTARADSHSVIGEVYGVSREDIKPMHTAFLHGASPYTMAKQLSKLTGKVYTEADITKYNEKAYGKAVHNINTIAEYGREIMSNTRSEVSWTMPDGFRATHRAYTVHVPLELQLHNRKVRLFSSMPLLLDRTGRPVYDSNAHGATEHTSTKIMGLYANIIHSIDAYVMREVIRSGIELLAKHDAFLIHPNDVGHLKTILQDVYSEIFEGDLIREILKQIEDVTGVEAPKMFIGDAENRMSDSHMFMTVE